jgi:hypothetical protein
MTALPGVKLNSSILGFVLHVEEIGKVGCWAAREFSGEDLYRS